MTISVTRLEYSVAELRRRARLTDDADQARRILAIALVLERASRDEAARAAGAQRQTLRDWVMRYNAEGLAGLKDRPRAGRRPRLGKEQLRDLDRLVEAGPSIAVDKVVRWRCIDLKHVAKTRFGVDLSERSMARILRQRRFTRLSVRPQHPQADAAAQETFKKNFAETVMKALPPEAKGKPLEIWFQDEARVGQKGTLTRIWARKGSRPRKPQDTRYQWAYIFGAVCPARATGAALVMPYADTEAMNAHLKEIAARVTPGAHAAVILDGAGWHTAKGLATCPNLTLITQPPYAPEVNPVENVWEYLRKNKLANRIYETYDAIVTACCNAWNDLMATPETVTSITTREWAKAL
ncbi:MAG: IS630 family transposase [Methylocella sp.]